MTRSGRDLKASAPRAHSSAFQRASTRADILRETTSWRREIREMYDVYFVILTLLFALVSILYVFGCERL